MNRKPKKLHIINTLKVLCNYLTQVSHNKRLKGFKKRKPKKVSHNKRLKSFADLCYHSHLPMVNMLVS